MYNHLKEMLHETFPPLPYQKKISVEFLAEYSDVNDLECILLFKIRVGNKSRYATHPNDVG